jgi:transposase
VSRQHGRGRPFPPEFRAEAVDLYRRSGKSIETVAAELGIGSETLRKWHKRRLIEDGEEEGLKQSEREELTELRRKVLRLEQERDLLKRAAAFFAKETETR